MRESKLVSGERVYCHTPIECFPHFIAPTGLGTVTDWAEDCLWIRWDRHIPGAEEWENEVQLGITDEYYSFADDYVHSIHALADRALQEIRSDFPGVGSWSELQDRCDANEILADLLGEVPADEAGADEWCRAANEVTALVDAALVAEGVE